MHCISKLVHGSLGRSLNLTIFMYCLFALSFLFVLFISEENECFDFDVIVTGGKPDKLKTNLVCNIQHRHEPVKLPIEVSFKVRFSNI